MLAAAVLIAAAAASPPAAAAAPDEAIAAALSACPGPACAHVEIGYHGVLVQSARLQTTADPL